MVPRFPTAPPWYQGVLTARWGYLKAVATASRVRARGFEGAQEMNQTASPLTGDPVPERLVAQGGDGYQMADALSRYVWTLPVVGGKRVVDLGCGTGYGAHVQSFVAASVVGVDVAPDAVAYAREHYAGPAYEVRDLLADPLPEADVATCFEVIEHLPQPERLLERVFDAYPRVLVSFPNPWWHNSQLNPHHVNDWPLSEVKRRLKEAGARQIRTSCQTRRTVAVVRGVRPVASSWVFDCSR